MGKRVVITGVLLVLAGVVVGVGIIMYIRSQDGEVSAASSGNTVALQDASSVSQGIALSPATSNGTNNIPVNTQDTAQNSQQNSQKSENTGNNTSSQTTTYSIPTIVELKSYEQYMNSKDAMFGNLIEGTGPVAAAGKSVTINYRGWLTDGKLFDDSYQRGKPLTFTLGAHSVVTGMEEGVFGMKVGGKRRVIIPPTLGYGATAHDPIPANSMMVFDVELVGVAD